MQWHSPTLEKTLCHAPFLAYGALGRSPWDFKIIKKSMKNPCPHGMDFSLIFYWFFNDFGVFFLPGVPPGESRILKTPKIGFYLILIDFGTPLGGQVGPMFGALGRALRRLGASRRVLRRPEALSNPFFSPPKTTSFWDLIFHRFRSAKWPQKSLKKH